MAHRIEKKQQQKKKTVLHTNTVIKSQITADLWMLTTFHKIPNSNYLSKRTNEVQ